MARPSTIAKIVDRKINDFIQAKADGKGEGELWIYGDIVDDKWYDNEVTANDIRSSLNAMGSISVLNIRINSNGGSTDEGNAIVNVLNRFRAKTGCRIIAWVDGIAASMGSAIAMVADYIYCAENALMMFHNPWTIAMGNADDLRYVANVLDKTSDTILALYRKRFNGTEDELKQILSDETYMNASEALSYGFCDEIVDAISIAASAKQIKFGNVVFARERFPAGFIKQTNGDDKGKEDKRDMSRFKYDSALMDRFGIDEAAFAEFGVSSESVVAILSAAKIEKPKAEAEEAEEADDAEKDGDGEEETEPKGAEEPAKVEEGLDHVGAVLTEDCMKTALGEAMNAEKILALAVAGKKYNELCKDAADEAIKQGVRAMGATFNEDRWRKVFSSGQFDLKDIQEQCSEWGGEAATALNAGKRMSVPAASEETNGKRKPTVAPKNRL
jgi:ATP-dependent Clp protease protease subunit